MGSRSVLIHCNADLERGMGHLMRSLCLAEEARSRGWKVAVAGVFGGRAMEHAAALVPDQQIIPLTGEDLPAALGRLIAEHSADLLHLDSYDTALDTIRPESVHVSNMQDGDFGRRVADLHIDANLDAELRYRRFSSEESVILGTAGMQIRPAVRALRHEVRGNLSAPFRVLVLLGGTDPFDLTPRLVQALVDYPEVSVTVICRPEAQPALIDVLGSDARRVEILSFTSDLPVLADSTDLVITAAGTSVWDFAAAGIPMGIIAVAENQLPGYRACEAHGIGFGLGEPPHADIGERISALVGALHDRDRLQRISVPGRDKVDGLGSWRVVLAWEEMIDADGRDIAPQREELVARAAIETDARRLFDWRNDESTRAVSRSNGEIAWGDHQAWFQKTLADTDRRLLMIERLGEPIATVRWDRRSERAWEASITLAPEHRGKGLAPMVLSAGERAFHGLMPVHLLAAIHISNAASLRLFARTGYLPHLPADEAGFTVRAKWLLP